MNLMKTTFVMCIHLILSAADNFLKPDHYQIRYRNTFSIVWINFEKKLNNQTVLVDLHISIASRLVFYKKKFLYMRCSIHFWASSADNFKNEVIDGRLMAFFGEIFTHSFWSISLSTLKKINKISIKGTGIGKDDVHFSVFCLRDSHYGEDSWKLSCL